MLLPTQICHWSFNSISVPDIQREPSHKAEHCITILRGRKPGISWHYLLYHVVFALFCANGGKRHQTDLSNAVDK